MPACAHSAPLCPEADTLSHASYLKTTVSLQLLGVRWAPCLFLLSENHCHLHIFKEQQADEVFTGPIFPAGFRS